MHDNNALKYSYKQSKDNEKKMLRCCNKQPAQKLKLRAAASRQLSGAWPAKSTQELTLSIQAFAKQESSNNNSVQMNRYHQIHNYTDSANPW